MKQKITLIILALWGCIYPIDTSAIHWGNSSQEKSTPTTVDTDFTSLTLEENILVPEVGKQARKIREVQYNELRRLRKGKFSELELIRSKEVIKATIPAANLFLPNDTALNDRADLYLRPLLQGLRTPEYYHVLLVMHSDDTGSEEYAMDITRYRVNAVKEWFQRNEVNTDFIFTYEAGAFEPVASNKTMEGRAQNRRLEIYLVPGQKMIDLAQQGKLGK